jgi:hypothetical protein
VTRRKAGYFNCVEAPADYYATLGVEPEADSTAIRIAYRNLMRRYHPDVNKSVGAVDKAMAINEAYACLSDPDARASYDWRRGQGRATQGFATQTAWQPPPHHNHRQHQWNRRRDQDLMSDLKFLLQPHKWNWLNLSLAVTITACIFTATSFVSPIVPVPAEALQVDVQPNAARCGDEKSGIAKANCGEPPATAKP